jgi:hypothetical protein
MATIDDLLNGLQNPNKGTLENTKDTWERIGNKDKFEELGLEKSALESFLKEWVEDNPYNLI